MKIRCAMCNSIGGEDYFFEYADPAYNYDSVDNKAANYCDECWYDLRGDTYHGLSDDEVLDVQILPTDLLKLIEYKRILLRNHGKPWEIGEDYYDSNMERVTHLIGDMK